MSFQIYPYSVDSATIEYDATHDSGYGEEMLNDRNKNFLFKDSAPGAQSVSIDFDLGSGVTRKADHLIIGNYKLSAEDDVSYDFLYSDDDSSYTSADSGTIAETTAYLDKLITFTKTASAHRYYRLTIATTPTNEVTNLIIGNIFFGEKASLSTSPSIDIVEGRGYKVVSNEGAGGYRFAQIANTNTRKFWQYQFEYVDSDDKTDFENVSGIIYPSQGFSRYPFYFSDDSGTTIYFVRMIGVLTLTQVAYQAYSTNLSLEEEL